MSEGPTELGERRTARMIFARALPHWRVLGLAALMLIAGSGISLALPRLAGDYGGTLLSSDHPGRALDSLREGLLVFAALLFAQSLLQALRRLLLVRVGERIVAELRIELYAHLLIQPLAFHTGQRTGDLLSRLGPDISRIQETVSSDIASLLRNGIILIGGCVLLIQTSPWLTLIMLVVIPPLVLILTVLGRRIRTLSRATQAGLAELNAEAQEVLSAIDVVQAFGREDYEVSRFRRGIEGVYAKVVRRAVFQDLLSGLTRLLGFAGLGVVLFIGGEMISEGGLEPGELLSFMFYTVMVASAVGSLSDLYSRMQVSLGAGGRVFSLLELSSALTQDQADTASPSSAPGPGHLRLRGLWFRYGPERPWALEDVDIEVPPDSVCALVGASGSGKTTLGRLVLRFWDPERGAIELDGHDLRDLRLSALRAQLAVVAQEPVLFSGTVRENIRYGRIEASDAEVEAAARAAYADEFIVRLEQGYDTRVGERGVKLSGGQRQRLAIARALLRDPLVLILDEATSALDSESEARVQAALEVLQRGRTTLVIAHRLSTVRNADQIVVLEHGRVIERGTHTELMAREGLYAAMVERQALLEDQDRSDS